VGGGTLKRPARVDTGRGCRRPEWPASIFSSGGVAVGRFLSDLAAQSRSVGQVWSKAVAAMD